MDEQKPERDRRFSPDEVGEIVELAGRLDDQSLDISRENLTEVAAELGVGEDALRAAIEQRDEANSPIELPDKAKTKVSQRTHLVNNFRRQLQSFLVTGTVVVAIDLMTTGAITWSRWPLFGVGIAVVIAGSKLIGPDDS